MRKFLIAASVAFLFAAPTPQVSAQSNSDTYRQLDLLMEVFERIRAEYVTEVEDKEVLEAAINGMLASLDPHSSYLSADNYRQMQVQTRGEYGGLGLEVSMENGFVRVISPIDETPADKAGMQGGDYITHIDGKQILGKTLNEAVEEMRGPVNSPVTITVVREGVEEPFEVTIVRDNIRVRSVRHRVERDNIGYIRITTFNDQTARGLRDSLNALSDEVGPALQGIVLDLRNNPGGLLDQAIAVSDMFLDKGEIVSTRGRRARDDQRWHASSGDSTRGLPIIVLVNPYSASASEIVAGALQDHRRATVIGRTTFGKGTVQTIIPLGAQSAMRLTTSRYYTPSGRSIQETGIEPDIEVYQRPEDENGEEGPAPRREADLEGHLTNDQIAAMESEESVPAKKAKTIHRPTKEQMAAAEESGTPLDFQLQYALDLMQGIGTVSQDQAALSN